MPGAGIEPTYCRTQSTNISTRPNHQIYWQLVMNDRRILNYNSFVPRIQGQNLFCPAKPYKTLSADFILYSRNKKCTVKCLNLGIGIATELAFSFQDFVEPYCVPTSKFKINLVDPNLDYAVFTLAYHHNLYPYSNVSANRINNSSPKSDPRKYF